MVFNDYFPHTNGFAIRCMREIKVFSELEKTVVVCRARANDLLEEDIDINGIQVKVYRFRMAPPINEQPRIFGIRGVNELYRNSWLFFSITSCLWKVLSMYQDRAIKLYVVSSPLFLAVVCSWIGYIKNVRRWLVGIHDLEPEMACHIKNLEPNHWFIQIEKILERLVCRGYANVLVTSHTQLVRINERTHTSKQSIYVIENIEPLRDTDFSEVDKINLRKQLGLKETDWVLGYTSSLTYRFTWEGLIDLLNALKSVKEKDPNLKLLIIGGGYMFEEIKNLVGDNDQILFSGMVENIYKYLSICNAGVIPWKKDMMTETQLPTKLFAYMQTKIPIIAPDFGEFSAIIQHKENGFLYNDLSDVIGICSELRLNESSVEQAVEKAYALYRLHYTEEVSHKKLLSLWENTLN